MSRSVLLGAIGSASWVSQGQVLYAGRNITQVPAQIIGRHFAYVGHDSYQFAGTIRDNLLLGVKHHPQSVDSDQQVPEVDESIEFKNWRTEARLSGNSDVDLNADWVDYERAGVTGATLPVQ